jgi:hypothetical protein
MSLSYVNPELRAFLVAPIHGAAIGRVYPLHIVMLLFRLFE